MACREDVQLAPLGDLVAIEVTPAEATVDAPGRVEFVALGTMADGQVRDVTSEVRWTVDERAPGDFEAPGRYRASGAAGGHLAVTAEGGGVTGRAALTVVLTATIVDPAFPPPPGGVELFASGATIGSEATRSPAMIYPEDGALAPRDLERLLFQWTTGQNNDVFQLAFDSDVLHLRVYTAADRWRPDDAAWGWIRDSAAGGEVVLTITAARLADSTMLYRGTPIALAFSRRPAGGTIYFWSRAREALVEGGVAASSATPFYPTDPDATCAGCHTVSRDGSRMALGYGGETLQTISVPARSVGIGAERRVEMGWATFSPDGRRILVANAGELHLYDADSGDPIGGHEGRVDLGGMMRATHPDWSPLGDYVAVSLASPVANRDMDHGQIARIPVVADEFGTLEILVPAEGMDNNFFPRYTPDGAWIVYAHAQGPSRNAESAELRLVAATGGTPIPLAAANGSPGGGTTMPSLAPSADGDLVWIAFSTIRPYGLVRPDVGDDQIWLTAIDLGRAAAGVDPSRPALWLPAQDVTQMNHLPVWAAVPSED
jgi:hypothetical protein